MAPGGLLKMWLSLLRSREQENTSVQPFNLGLLESGQFGRYSKLKKTQVLGVFAIPAERKSAQNASALPNLR